MLAVGTQSWIVSAFLAFRYQFLADILPAGKRFLDWRCTANLEGICRRCIEAVEDCAQLFSCSFAKESSAHDALATS